MLRRLIFVAAIALAACNQEPAQPLAEGPDAVQPGALNAPSEMNAAAADGQALLTAEQRTQLEGLVRGYLDNAQTNLAQGLTPAAGFSDEVTSLQPGRDHRWQVNLEGGRSYRIIGGCDNECSNLDIELIDSRGAVVASDVLPDDFPLVNFTPAQSGQYIVRIMMQACSVAPCYAGARILQAPTI